MQLRSSGILLHISSLPSDCGIGDLGPEAYAFARFLERTGQRIWQMLPLTPTSTDSWNDPYHSISAFAGNPLLISPERLKNSGWLSSEEFSSMPDFPKEHVDFEAVTAWKGELFRTAFSRFTAREHPDYALFCSRNAGWLNDFALFAALGKELKAPWYEWPSGLRDRNVTACEHAREELAQNITYEKFLQWLFDQQWRALKRFCNERNIQIFGDMPIYVDHNSADLWCRPDEWQLDEKRQPTGMAGVPPDYFSETGQLWESPLYDWDAMKDTGFAWWQKRIFRNLDLFDILRIDHFRGLIAYWDVPAGEKTALNGKWVEAPFQDLFDSLYSRQSSLPLVAEDLGVITPDVREAMQRYDLPGMKILQFAFGPDLPQNLYAPHNIPRHALVYTGTHDNLPTRGWFEDEADSETKTRLAAYLGHEASAESISWEMIRLAMLSHANTAISPMQDLLSLDGARRMNSPGTLSGNWTWRMLPAALTPELEARLHQLTVLSGRHGPERPTTHSPASSQGTTP
ncbi:4-alpha-glucanotransferase [Desulfobaculum bizertense]|uniref:4-alpha-glucanotransferase n=1 Tax=Desulfobaculum bizertense DSM 18034 TaxID=1121442 RepID=A0A1T4WBK8_9BACT|nr:4-alpha-glucanotransferase [Desulfobaculum bizertense]UIJ37481.1 4-alpha-glucanotransferase [Desulfobaculum bizertense]SKA74694.1 4-alpha-glucanotransferase [Desulfobaculum bizertense DSM 18034]